jgi:hypothetical protein
VEEVSVFFVAAGPVIGIVVGLVGILIAIRPPTTRRMQIAIGVMVAVLSALAVFTEIRSKREDAAHQGSLDGQLTKLQVAADTANKAQAHLAEQNRDLQASNATLSQQLEEIKRKPGAFEAGQGSALREDIQKQIQAIREFKENRDKEDLAEEKSAKRRTPKDRMIFQQTTAALYAVKLCPTTAHLLMRAAELNGMQEPIVTCSPERAYALGAFEGAKELGYVYEHLPK